MKIQFLIAAAAVTALAGAGCGSSPAPTPVNTAKNAPPERQMAPTAGIQLPADFPTDYPRYSNAMVISAINTDKHSVMSLTSEEEAGIILSWYNQAFISAGYTADQTATIGTVTSKSYLKGDIKFVVNVDNQAGKHPATLFSVTRTDLSQN